MSQKWLPPLVVLLIGLSGAAHAQQPHQLPPVRAQGASCLLLLPCTTSGPVAGHMDAQLELRPSPDPQGGMDVGGQLGLSFSLPGSWGAAGLSFYGMHTAAGLLQGPVTLWGRLSPSFLSSLAPDATFGAALALQAEYAVGQAPFDAGGTLYPDTQRYLLVGEAVAWWLRASLSIGPELAGGAGYRGLLAGGGLWLQLDGPGIRFGGEVMGRAGTEAGSGRTDWTAALSLRLFDQDGHHVKGGFLRDTSGSTSILIGYGISCGPSYAAASCFRELGRSLFERAQDSIGAAILSSWRARKEAERLAERYAAAQRPAAGSSSDFRMDWMPARAFDPPPQAECPPYDVQLRIYPCRVKVAGWRSAADLIKGAITGTVESLPGANLAPRVPPGPTWFEVGRGAAAVATGVVETIGGAAGAAAGGGVSGTGAGALVGVPVAAGSVAVGASGVKAVGDGVKRLVTLHRDEDHDTTPAGDGGGQQGPKEEPDVPKKKCSSPGGCRGNPDHEATVERLVLKAQQEFPDREKYQLLENRSIKKLQPGNVNRKPDVTVVNKQTKRIEKVYEAARTLPDGKTFVPRERKKMDEYRKAGIPFHMEPVK